METDKNVKNHNAVKIKDFPIKLRKLAIEEYRKQSIRSHSDTSIERLFLGNAMDFSKTSQGDAFWRKIYETGEIPNEYKDIVNEKNI